MANRRPANRPVRIAMWSGPRNISTALMRSWESRPDTYVCDEPLYAHYLQRTGAPHPGAREVLARHERDWRKVVAWLTGPVPHGRRIFYQKHMAQHLLPDVGRDWLHRLEHGFLIREPAAMLASLARKLGPPTLEDTGLPQQAALFDWARERSGAVPPVLDASDVLADPRRALSALCAALGVEFTTAMLAWRPGRRETDGAWAPYWYESVEASTGFVRPRAKGPVAVPGGLEALHEQCLVYYRHLAQHRIGTRKSPSTGRDGSRRR